MASTTAASAGSYGIGAGVGSSVGAVHTANAATSYVVAAPSVALQTTVGTNKTTYAGGETVQIYAFVRNNGVPVTGVSVRFIITRPDGKTTILNATSGSDGYARTSYKVPRTKGALGLYSVEGTWALGNVTARASVTFRML